MPPHYPFPWRIAIPLCKDVLRMGHRSFPTDARIAISLLSPPLKIVNSENIPSHGPALLLTNHYSRPGFPAWWIALAISASMPDQIHWLMTDAWTFLGPLTYLSHWVLTRVAKVYGFTTSPPMPPRPEDVEARAWAVRRVLKVARSTEALIALVPEGRDQPGGILGSFPSGAGRFIEKLAIHCQRIVPIGVYEDEDSLCLRFGPPLRLRSDYRQSAKIRDQIISQQVMFALAQQLPARLREEYGNQDSSD